MEIMGQFDKFKAIFPLTKTTEKLVCKQEGPKANQNKNIGLIEPREPIKFSDFTVKPLAL